MSIKHVVSVSGGKDSTATLLIALGRFGRDSVIPIFCDTGNEHELVYEYLDYLETTLGIRIIRLKASFDEQIAAKRMFIARDMRSRRVYQTRFIVDEQGRPVWARDGCGRLRFKEVRRRGEAEPYLCKLIQKEIKIGGGHRVRWSNKAKRRALQYLHPSGMPFLDLCMWKGRFPSRKAQFCTDELKVMLAVEFQLGLIDAGNTVVSWQGVRRDESVNRREAKLFERQAPRLYIYRPLVDWSATEVFAYAANSGIKPNPLYLQNMSRVGCMICINVNKEELRESAARFPAHIQRISRWERQVSLVSKRQGATFIPAPGITPAQSKDHGIYSVIQWAKTTRGGKQYDLLASLIEPDVCASSYGLCDQAEM